jgi:hypothetical protein
MKNLVQFTILIVLLFVTSQIYSHPRFSVRLQDKCIDCHYNPTGGIIRNEGGFYYGKNIMSMMTPREDEFAMSPKISNNITIGLDYRTQFLYSEQRGRADFQQMTGALYTNFGLSKKINLVGRYDFIWSIWEAYGVAHILPNNSYVKVGSFQPNYGIRIDDHTAYTRGGDYFLLALTGRNTGLIYNPFYTEAGLETGFYISDWGLLTASAAANLNNTTLTRDPTYTTRLEVNPSLGRIGMTFGGSYAAVKLPRTADFYGGFAGIGYDRFALLAEFDIANNVFAADVKSNMMMIEASYALLVGLEAIVRYDWIDPNKDISDDEITRLIVGLEWFPYAFLEIRPQYRFILETPSVDNNSFVLQFHFWY